MTKKKLMVILGCSTVLLVGSVAAAIVGAPRLVMTSLANSHINANVPSPEKVDPLLRQALAQYLVANSLATSVRSYELLRKTATQTGVAFPKFYAWVCAVGPDNELVSGAARIEAINKQRFHVTDFLTQPQLEANAHRAEVVFPASLLDDIQQMASADPCGTL